MRLSPRMSHQRCSFTKISSYILTFIFLNSFHIYQNHKFKVLRFSFQKVRLSDDNELFPTKEVISAILDLHTVPSGIMLKGLGPTYLLFCVKVCCGLLRVCTICSNSVLQDSNLNTREFTSRIPGCELCWFFLSWVVNAWKYGREHHIFHHGIMVLKTCVWVFLSSDFIPKYQSTFIPHLGDSSPRFPSWWLHFYLWGLLGKNRFSILHVYWPSTHCQHDCLRFWPLR